MEKLTKEEKKLESSKKKLLSEDVKFYQEVQEPNVVISKDDNDKDEHLVPSKDELKHSKDHESTLEHIRRKCKFKQEYVDNHIILSVNHLKQYFTFGSGISKYKLKAVHDVSFQIHEGECFGLVGESGCGKTTTGRSIIRLYNITSGSIYYKGYRIGAGSRWNEKEIKYTKIRLKNKLKELKERLAKNEITEEEYHKQVESEKEYAKNVCKVQKAKIKQIKYDDKHAGENFEGKKQYAIDKEKYKEEIAKAKNDLATALSELEAKLQDKSIEMNDYKAAVATEKQKFNDFKTLKKQELEKSKVESNKNLMREIQMIFQDPIDSLDPRMTVETIISEGLKIQGYRNRAENHKRVVEALERVGLIEDYANRYPHEFSGGQRQRIGIARALVMNPKFLICDEPISALDVSIRAQIINLLNDLKEEMNLSMLFIAHDLSVVKYFCDRIAVMYFGEIVELATSDELFKHPLHPYTKSLLSAIPKPNPLTEKERVRIVYNPLKEHDYSQEKPKMVEILPGHFILANSVEVEKYKKEIEKLDIARKLEEEHEKELASSENHAEVELNPETTSETTPETTKETPAVSEEKPIEEVISEVSKEEKAAEATPTSEEVKETTSEEVKTETQPEEEPLVKEETSVVEEAVKEEKTVESATQETPKNDEEAKEKVTSEKETVTKTSKTPSTRGRKKGSTTTTKKKEEEVSDLLLKQRSGEIKKVYHVKKVDGKWEIVLKDGLKAIKTFATKPEAVEYANNLAKSQNGTVLIHASKGKNKGKFIK